MQPGHLAPALCLCLAAPLQPTAASAAESTEERRRLSLEFSHVSDTLAVKRENLELEMAFLHKSDLSASWTSGAIEMFADAQYVGGDEPTGDLIGDIQAVSNIEAPAALRILEAWAAQRFAGGRAGVKAGLIDLNSEFDIQSVGALFLGSSHGIGPDFSQTGLAGPSIFPNTSLAVTAYGSFGPDWTLRAGAFDAAPGDPDDPRRILVRLSRREGALLVVEGERRLGESGRFKAGAWRYTASFDAVDAVAPDGRPLRLSGNQGAYAILEGRLWSAADDRAKGLDAWIRVGLAESKINPIGAYVGGGLSFTGVVASDDKLGLAFGHAAFGNPARRALGLERGETVAELTWSLPVNERLTIQPDLQYVWNPGGDPASRDALAAGVRVSWTGRLN